MAAGDIHAFPNTEEGINNEASVRFALYKDCTTGTSSRAARRQWEKAAGGSQRCSVGNAHDGEHWEEWEVFKMSSKYQSFVVNYLKFCNKHG